MFKTTFKLLLFFLIVGATFANGQNYTHNINFKVWIVNDSNSNGLTETQVQSVFDEVQLKFDPAGIEISRCFEVIENDELYNNVALSKRRDNCYPFDPSRLNFYVSAGCPGGNGCGNMPGGYPVGYSCTVDCYHITHEIGHMLNLFHTDHSYDCNDEVLDGSTEDSNGCKIYSRSDEGDFVVDTPLHPSFSGNCSSLHQTATGAFLSQAEICLEISNATTLGSELAGLDCDGDGYTNEDECLALTHYLDPWHYDAQDQCLLDWNAIFRCPSGMTFSPDHDPEDILRLNIMGQVWPLGWPSCFDACVDQSFTCGQQVRMRNAIDSPLLSPYVTDMPSCDVEPLVLGQISGTVTIDNTALIDQDIIVPDGANLVITAPLLLFEPGIGIVVESGGMLNLSGSILTSADCVSSTWGGIVVEADGQFDAFDTNIEAATTGLELRTTSATTNLLRFENCGTGLLIANVGDVVDDPIAENQLQLQNCTFISSPTTVINSCVFFRGCHFGSQSNLTCDDASVFAFPSNIAPFRRCEFVLNTIVFNSGPRLMIDFCFFSRGEDVYVQVDQCGFLTVCNSLFEEGFVESIISSNVNKYDVFQNIFDSSSFAFTPTLQLNDGGYGSSGTGIQEPGSFIRDNIFNNGARHISTNTDTESLDIFCNQHNAYNDRAWFISGQLKDQGTPLMSPQNSFDYSGVEDIRYNSGAVAQPEFTYHSFQNELGRPLSVFNVFLNTIQGLPDNELCNSDMQLLVDDWNGYLDCYDQMDYDNPERDGIICCACCRPPATPTENPFPIDPNNPPSGPNSGESIEGRSKNFISIYPNPVKQMLNVSNAPVTSICTIFNITGSTVFRQRINEKDEIDVSFLNNGIYYISIENADKVIYEDKFVKMD